MRRGLKNLMIGGAVALTMTTAVFAQEEAVKLKIEDAGKEHQLDILMQDGKTYFPARPATLEMGGSVEWIGETRELILMKDDKSVKLTMDSSWAKVNGQDVEMEDKPFFKDGNAYISARLLAEGLGFDVDWESQSSTVVIRSKVEEPEPVIEEVKPSYSQEDLELLSRIVYVEARGLSQEAKLAVANVVMNRVKSPRFPNTIKEVIYQRGQFPPAHKSSFLNNKVSSQALEAAKRALEGENNIDDCLFFNNRPFKSKKNDLYKVIEGEYFYH